MFVILNIYRSVSFKLHIHVYNTSSVKISVHHLRITEPSFSVPSSPTRMLAPEEGITIL
jgi:hypothetical protein